MLLFKLFQRKSPVSVAIARAEILPGTDRLLLVLASDSVSPEIEKQFADLKRQIEQGDITRRMIFVRVEQVEPSPIDRILMFLRGIHQNYFVPKG